MLKTLKFEYDPVLCKLQGAAGRMANDLRQGVVVDDKGMPMGKWRDLGLSADTGLYTAIQEIDTDTQFIHSDMT